MYRSIEKAIKAAIDEVRVARFDANERQETDINVFNELNRIQAKLNEALNEVSPF